METATYELEKRHPLLLLKKIEDTSDFFSLKDCWEGLLSQSRNESIFLTWDWVYNWWLVYREGRQLFILTVEDDKGNLWGIAPLVLRKIFSPLGRLTILEFLGTGERKKDKVCPEFLDFIAHKDKEEEAIKAIFDYLLDNTSKWDILNLEGLLNNSNILRYISAKKNERLMIWKASNKGCGYNYLVLSGDWDAYINFMGAHFRQSLKYARKSLKKHGKVCVRICDNETSLTEDMQRFIQLHQLRWNSLGKPGCFASEKFTNFHQRLANSLLRKGRLILQLLEINDKPQACEYAFEYNRRLFIYQSGFNPHLAKNASLGHLSISYLVEYAFAAGIKEIELLRGGELYKERWSKDKRLIFNIVIAHKNLKGSSYIVIRMTLEKLKHLIRGIINNIQRA